MSQFQTDMKQKLLSILSEKNNKTTKHLKPCASLDQIKSNKLPVEMTNFERERWIFEMLCTQDIAKQEKQLQDIYIRTSKVISRCKNKEMRWDQKRAALVNEIELLKSLLS